MYQTSVQKMEALASVNLGLEYPKGMCVPCSTGMAVLLYIHKYRQTCIHVRVSGTVGGGGS